MEVDRVMVMQSSVTAYSSFIWDVGPDSDLQTLLKSSTQLFNALEQDPKLPQKFIDTGHHLPWIQVIQERHGSVETSSLQQVEAINKTGVYHVPSDRPLSLQFQQVEGVAKGNKDYRRTLSKDDLNELRRYFLQRLLNNIYHF